ncbi:MAG: L-threonylcarbamoyladenylate synthase [Candidatus Dormibacteria bacterium]
MSTTLDDAVAALAAGEVVAVPTDTVYGLVCDPANREAVERVYAIKERPAGLELTLLAADVAAVEEAVELDEFARSLAARYWPGPLSIVAPVRGGRLAIPRAGITLSTRIPNHQLLLELLRRTGPLASTSANRHGVRPAADAASAAAELGGRVAAVLDGGSAAGLASTIIDCSRTPPRVLRAGPIPEAELLASAPIQTTTRYDAG